MDELFDTLIQKKIEYLLRILKQEQEQEENKNNNLSTLVETAIEVIKENQKKLKSFKFSSETNEIKDIITELQQKSDHLTDEEFNNLLISSLNSMRSIEDEKILNENMKPEYNKVMNELLALSKDQKDISNETNISKLVETAIDVITHNNNISKNKKYIDEMEEKYKGIKNKFKEIIKKIIQTNKDKKTDNTKELLLTAIDIISQPKPTPTPQPNLRDNKKDNNKVLVETAIDILSQPKQTPQEIKSDDKNEEEKNIQTKLSSIFRRFNNEYIFFNKFLNDNISEINEKKNAEINKLKEDYENQLKIIKTTIIKLENEIKNYEEKDENSWDYVNKQVENIKSLKRINEEKEEKIKDLETEKTNNKNAIDKLNLDIEQRNKQIEVGNNRIKYLQERITRTQSDNTRSIEEKDKNIENLEKTKIKNEETIRMLTINLKNQFEQKKTLLQQNNGLQQQIEDLKHNIEHNNQTITELRTEIEKNKKEFENATEKYLNQISIMTNDMKYQQEAFEKTINEKINEIGNLKEEVKNKDKQLLNVIKKITDFIPNLQDDINKLDIFLPELDKMKNILQGIKSKTDCPGTDNLIGKIDNECLYFNKDTNTIESKSNEDNVLDALIEENKKIREAYKEKIGIIKTLNSKKIRDIEELKNNKKVEIEEKEEEYSFVSG